MLVGLKRISTAFGVLAALAASAQAQGVAPTGNQATANAVASSLRQSPTLSRYRIEIETRNGVVSLSGAVATQAQRAEAIARVRIVPGVSGVKDQLAVTGAFSVSLSLFEKKPFTQSFLYPPRNRLRGRHFQQPQRNPRPRTPLR